MGDRGEHALSRGYVLIVGPDGAGKTTVVDALEEAATTAGVTVNHAHHRPGLIAGRASRGPVTDPHAKPARRVGPSLLKLGVVFADHFVGGHVRWRAQRRASLLLVERGWFDMVVDPRRYRIPETLLPLVRALGRLLPRPDLVLLVGGDADALHARKPEIGAEEVGRQMRAWREVASSASPVVVESDTVRESVDCAVAAVAAEQASEPWRSVPLTPARLDLRVTGDARAALKLYQPQTVRARGGEAARSLTGLRGRRTAPPLPGLADLWHELGLRPDGVATMRSSTASRLVLSVVRDGRMQAVLKVGALSDTALRHEAEMLAAPMAPDLPIGRPALIWAGIWRERFVVVTEAVARVSAKRWTADEIVPLAEGLARAGADGAPLIHGDLAPWNMIRTPDQAILLDWEFSRWADEPLHDLAHFVVQAGALLGQYRPAHALELLCDVGSPGYRLLRARGLDAGAARPLLGEYLATARRPTEPRAVRFQSDMLRLVSS